MEHRAARTRLGNYAIVRKLARGGMAELFLARDVDEDDKIVVLKQILPRYATNQRFVQLFLDEAKLAASLHHPNIAEANDLGEQDGTYFFTMEYVHGQDVRSILRRTERMRKQVPIELVLQIARAVASALHFAHEWRQVDGSLLGVVHRDVSPSNILVGYDGAIKLADFGVAKASSSSVRTRTGTLKGKVGYMSPEQARGAPIDRRSDIFSLGVVLWELLALRRLFKADNDLATIQSIITAPPPALATIRTDCPTAVEAIIRRALEKDPATRYQTADELQSSIEVFARAHEHSFGPAIPRQYMSELFAPEIAAWRTTGTITGFVIANEPTMQINTRDVIADSSFEPDDSDHDDDDEDIEELDESELADASVTRLPELAPRAGSIMVDAELEKTDFGPPPVMSAMAGTSPVTSPGMPALDQTHREESFETPTAENAQFQTEAATVQQAPFGYEGATATEIATLPRHFGDMPSVVVAAMTPPVGMPSMPHPHGMPHGVQYGVPHHGVPPGMPQLPPGFQYPTEFPQALTVADEPPVDLTPKHQWLILGGIAAAVALLFLIVAIASC